MMTAHDRLDTSHHLLSLGHELVVADSQEPPDPGWVSRLAWQLFAELNAAEFELAETEGRLELAYTAARAAVADAGCDPLSHLRRLLAAHGGMPPPGTAATTVLAWQDQPLPRPRPAGPRRPRPRLLRRCPSFRKAVR